MTHTARELQVSPVADAVDLPIEGPFLPAPVARFLASVAQRLLPWAVPIGLIALWQIASSQGWLSTRVLPAPLEVVKAAWTLAASGELWTHVQVSAGRALAGLAVGGGLGCLLRLVLGLLRRRGGDDAVIMLRMLKIILGHDAVAAGIGVAGQLQILLIHMRGRAADLHFRTVGIVSAVGIEAAAIVAAAATAAAAAAMLRPAAASA